MAVALADGAVDPAALRHAGGEDVVEVHAQVDLLHGPARLERIAEAEVGEAVGGQRTVHVLAVVQVHATDVAGVPHGAEAAEMHVHEAVQDRGRRECQGLVGMVEGAGLVAVAVAVV